MDSTLSVSHKKGSGNMGKEVVTFGKELVALEGIANEARKVQLSNAYRWAEAQRLSYGFLAQPLRLTFEHGDVVDDGNGFIISLFYDGATGRALLRRDWEERGMVQYNILVNYDEICRIAPKSTEQMLRNGLRLQSVYNNQDPR